MADEDLRDQLRSAGLRATQSRITVLRLLRGRTVPTSHPEVSALLAEGGWDRVTLYRNLVDMTEAGLLRRVDHGDHVWRFELVGSSHDGSHPHFLCTACGEILCLPEIEVPKTGLPRSIAGGEVVIQLRGLCDDCYV